jgi:hypothetical protein
MDSIGTREGVPLWAATFRSVQASSQYGSVIFQLIGDFTSERYCPWFVVSDQPILTERAIVTVTRELSAVTTL